jgi:hypothetical protein
MVVGGHGEEVLARQEVWRGNAVLARLGMVSARQVKAVRVRSGRQARQGAVRRGGHV